MPSSTHRLSLTSRRRTAMETTPLDPLIDRFYAHHRALNHSEATIDHYRESFRDFDRFLADTKRPRDLSILTTATIEAFTIWLRETPIQPWRGSTKRSIQGLHGRLKDLRSFASWLYREEI